jgi:GDP-L-fucose synthase
VRIFVAGHRGMVGSAIVRDIEKNGVHTWLGASRQDLDLRRRDQVFAHLENVRPDAIIIAAAKVGGIGANDKYPVDFLSENLQIQTNLIDASHHASIQRLVFLGSSCIYPKHAEQPIREASLLTGSLEPTNEAYALAKIAGLKLVDAYKKQYGHSWFSLMPTNLYGIGDNFDPIESHVIPGLITKFELARRDAMATVELWGTGSPLREFLYVDDLARACLFALENYDGGGLLNVGSGRELTILDLATLISDLVGYSGQVIWNHDMPDGTPRKLLDSSELLSLGWAPEVELEDGLNRVINRRGN